MKKKTMNREPSSETMIRFQDCDPLGHLNNARYLDYFINAREDHLADYYGLDAKDLKAVVWIEFRHFDLGQKQPTPHCGDVMALFEQIAFPVPVHKEFDARVRNIFQNSLKIKQGESVVKGGAHV